MQHEESSLSASDAVFGQRLLELRIEKGWSQRELSTRLAERGLTLDSSAISRMEKGQRSVRLIDAIAIADVFDVHITSLLRPAERESLQDRLRDEYMSFQRSKNQVIEAVTTLMQGCDTLETALGLLTAQDRKELGHVVDMAEREVKDAVVSAVKTGRQDYEREAFGEVVPDSSFDIRTQDAAVRDAVESDD